MKNKTGGSINMKKYERKDCHLCTCFFKLKKELCLIGITIKERTSKI